MYVVLLISATGYVATIRVHWSLLPGSGTEGQWSEAPLLLLLSPPPFILRNQAELRSKLFGLETEFF